MGLRERAGKDAAGSVGRSRTILLSSHLLTEALADRGTNRPPGYDGTAGALAALDGRVAAARRRRATAA